MDDDQYPGCFSSIALSWCVIGLFVGVVGANCGACGPVASTQTRVSYAEQAAHCDELERAIIARPDSTLEEDLDAMRLERIRCTAALAEILDGGTP